MKNILNKLDEYLKRFFSKIVISRLFFISIIFFGIVIISVFIVASYKTIYSSIYHERIDKLKYMTDFAIELIKDENKQVLDNKKTLKQAQRDVIETLKDIRFENNDYIWINDYDGIIIYHPYPQFIKTDIRKFIDNKSYKFGEQLVKLSKEQNGGYVTYNWIKIDDFTNKYYPKVSYVQGFKPWNWVIGTGLYIDDIQNKVIESMLRGLLVAVLVSALLILIFRYIIWTSIVKPIQELAEKSLKLANKEYDITISRSPNKTEIGTLYNALSKFVDLFKEKRLSEKNLSIIYNNISDVLITTDDEGEVLSANPAVEKIFGYSQKEIIGLNINMLTSPVLFADNIVAGQRFKRIGGKHEVLGIKKTEDFFNAEVNINKIYDGDNEIYIILIRDITEQKEIEKMKSEFVSIVSHELRTPLTVIRGSLGLLLGGNFKKFDDKVMNLLEIANSNSLKLIDLINDILDIEKIEAGKIEYLYELTDVAKVVEEGIKTNNLYFEKFNVKPNFVNNLADAEIYVSVDPKRFNQILTNLLSNGIKFSSENSTLDVVLSQEANNVKIGIRDYGRGIPDSFKDKVFSKFTQADSSDSRKKGGTGLGLSICKRLAEEMGGEITFESEFGKGTTFFIIFPIAER